MTEDQVLVINNFIKKIRIYTEVIGGRLLVKDDVTIANLNIPVNTFNVLLPRATSIHDVNALKQLINEEPFQGYPLSVWIKTQYISDDWKSFFQNYQLEEIERNVMMKLSQVCLIHQNKFSPLEIVSVRNTVDLMGYVEVFVSLFDNTLESETLERYFQMFAQLNQHENVQMFVGYIDEIVVTTGLLIEDKHSYGIYDLMTKELFRGKGYGSSMVQFLLQQITAKQKQTVLQASIEGLGIYKRLGFIEVGEMFVFE